MATRPGTRVTITDAAPPRGVPTDTGTWFVAGTSEKGREEPILVRSLGDFLARLGERQSTSFLYDAVESFFREGGQSAYVSRVLGPADATATVNLQDGSSVDTLQIDASSPGEWGNELNVQVTASGTANFILTITDGTVTVETSPPLTDVAAAVAWASQSDYVRATALSTDDPAVVAATSLAGGDADAANITDTEWQDAIDLFVTELGPGQVSMPGRTTSVAHTALLTHAHERNRAAVLDAPDSGTKATLLTAASSLSAIDGRRQGMLLAPWVTVPGLTTGTTRTVPPSGVVCGMIARVDATFGPNEPAAGELGISRWAVGLSQDGFSGADRTELNGSSVNLLRVLYGDVKLYGYRTLANPTLDAQWRSFNNSRLIMGIAAEADAIAESYVFAEIDGQGIKLGKFAGDLTGLLMGYWEAGSLFGDTPDDAFSVDIGESVNPLASLEAGDVRAALGVRVSPFAELVQIDIVKVSITEAVA